MMVSSSIPRLILILAISFFASGCGKSDAEKFVAEAREVNSWAASAQMISAAWAKGKVPNAYAQRSFENIHQQLSDSNSRIKSLSNEHRLQLTATLQQLLNVVSQLEAASKQQDKGAISPIDEQLSGARSALDSILKNASQSR
jgi:hypothetical protein